MAQTIRGNVEPVPPKPARQLYEYGAVRSMNFCQPFTSFAFLCQLIWIIPESRVTAAARCSMGGAKYFSLLVNADKPRAANLAAT